VIIGNSRGRREPRRAWLNGVGRSSTLDQPARRPCARRAGRVAEAAVCRHGKPLQEW
jgi:hypothetical protein